MRVGPYEIIHELGQGGMGRVRLARAPDGRRVVLKDALRAEPDDDERLRDEARVGLRLRHPGVVETVELLEVPDGQGRLRPVLVTAFVAGVSFLELRRSGPAPAALVCRLGRQLAGALDAIHDIVDDEGRPLGVLHRDVTAGNCLLGEDGDARLIDFGIARSGDSRAVRTQSGLVRGTLRYLAPELFAGGGYSRQSDLWSLGVVLFELLVGRPAVEGNDIAAMGRICVGDLMELREGEAPDPRVLRALSQLLQKAPQDRPRRARDTAALFAMLEKALGDDGGVTTTRQAIDAVQRARVRPGARPIAGGPALPPTVVFDLVDEETSAEFAAAGIDVVVEPPFSHLPPTHAELPTPRLGVSGRAGGSVALLDGGSAPAVAAPVTDPVDGLRAYAASLVAMEKQLDHAVQAGLAAERAQRDLRASLQDTGLWVAPGPVAPPPAFRTPPETVVVRELVAGGASPSPPTPSSPAPSSPAPSSPAPSSPAPSSSSSPASPPSWWQPPTAGLSRVDTGTIDRMLDAFLHDEDTPTPALSPAQQRQALERLAADPAVAAAAQRSRRRGWTQSGGVLLHAALPTVAVAVLAWIAVLVFAHALR
jgi:serine/threonine protein kinase